jgi:hypothetical protein
VSARAAVALVVVAFGLAFARPALAGRPLDRAAGWFAAAADSGAPADTTVQRYFEDLADSTSRFFGRTAAPLDTTGLDSALAYRLVHPTPVRTPRRLTIYPDLDFQRVDGRSTPASSSTATCAAFSAA